MFEHLYGTHKPDILDCISNLSSDEVFTPPDVVNQVLDLLPAEVWTNPDLKFLDPACKSGVFLREAAKRLLDGLKDAIPDEGQRREHIFKNMLFGIAITELTGLISRRSLYYSKDASSEHSVIHMGGTEGNIHYSRGEHKYVGDKCIVCGAPKGKLDRGEHLENYAYQFLHRKDIFKMKFDVVIGNPPYQLQDAGKSTGASPIYHRFIQQAIKLEPRYISMIIPSRWFARGKGLEKFRESFLSDKRVSHLVDHTDARDCFPSVDISGGICYFLWDARHNGDVQVTSHHAGNTSTSTRPLGEFETFIRFNEAVSILRKVQEKTEPSLTPRLSSFRPFGLRTYVRPEDNGDLILVWHGGDGPYKREKITVGSEMIDRWKVLVSKVSYDHAGQPDKDGTRRVLSRTFIAPPQTICTETYVVAGHFETKEEAENYLAYIKSKFVRFLVSLLSFSHDITKNTFKYVPDINYDVKWTDEKLYKRYGLDNNEIDFIESMIREMP